jgi:hypothetical protein
MNVGADGVGWKAETQCPIRHGPQEARRTVPEIEEDAPLAGLVHESLLEIPPSILRRCCSDQ